MIDLIDIDELKKGVEDTIKKIKILNEMEKLIEDLFTLNVAGEHEFENVDILYKITSKSKEAYEEYIRQSKEFQKAFEDGNLIEYLREHIPSLLKDIEGK